MNYQQIVESLRDLDIRYLNKLSTAIQEEKFNRNSMRFSE